MGNITLDDIKRNHGKEFTGTVDGEVVSGIIDVTDKGTVNFYFNSKNGAGWPTANKPGYMKGWSIGNTNIPPDLVIKDFSKQPTTNVTTIPKYFCVKKDITDSRWPKYIDWLNSTYGYTFTGESYMYYGYDGGRSCDDCHCKIELFKNNPVLITLNQWEEMVSGIELAPIPMSTITTTPTTNTLPEYFTIKGSTNNTHPLGGKYVDWINKKFKTNYSTGGESYYGLHKNGCGYNWDHEMQGEPEITLELWDRIINSKNPVPDKTADVVVPKYYYIKRDSSNPLWEKYIEFIQDKTNGNPWSLLLDYVGFDGSYGKGGTDIWDNPDRFSNGATEITLEFWNQYINESKLPMYAMEDMVSATDIAPTLWQQRMLDDATNYDAKTIVENFRQAGKSKFNSKVIDEAMDKLRNADPYDVLSKSHVAHSILMNDYIDSARYRTASLADMGICVDAGVPDPKYAVIDEAISGPDIQPVVPVKKSRYSSMLDLI